MQAVSIPLIGNTFPPSPQKFQYRHGPRRGPCRPLVPCARAPKKNATSGGILIFEKDTPTELGLKPEGIGPQAPNSHVSPKHRLGISTGAGDVLFSSKKAPKALMPQCPQMAQHTTCPGLYPSPT